MAINDKLLEIDSKDVLNKKLLKDISKKYLNIEKQLKQALQIIKNQDNQASMFLTTEINSWEYKFVPAIININEQNNYEINQAYVIKPVGYGEQKDSFHLLEDYLNKGFPARDGKICVSALLTTTNPMEASTSELKEIIEKVPHKQKQESNYKVDVKNGPTYHFADGDELFISARLLSRKKHLNESRPKQFKNPSTYHIHSAPHDFIDGIVLMDLNKMPIIKNEKKEFYESKFKNLIEQNRFKIIY